MSAKRTYFGYTTAQQRKLLFEVWERTKNIPDACHQARVSQRLFYYWKPRFEQAGYAGLETFRSRVAHQLHKKDAALEKEVVELRRKNPDWGKLRIAQELAKANHWVPVVSPNTVRRMLQDAGLWPERRAGKKPGNPVARTADQPGQAINVDLCFVPLVHSGEEKLPAVSGSSGHLVIERLGNAAEPPVWPGQVFGDPDLTFAEAMQPYIAATQDRFLHPRRANAALPTEPSRWRIVLEAHAQRHLVIEQRQGEDRVWRTAKAAFRQAKEARKQQPKAQRKAQRAIWEQVLRTWIQCRAQRSLQFQIREQENEIWHQSNLTRQGRDAQNPAEREWLAVLVITDNCTRQCLGLPLFRSGASVTSLEVVDALRTLLPPELLFLISDQGKHFKTQWMAQLAEQEDFVQVLVYRHRPQSNGIAERFVLTFKRWLRNRSWNLADELEPLVALFVSEYNQRPHQGLAIPGLSPLEFAQRFWLL